MATQWYLRDPSGTASGPFTADELRRMAAQDLISSATAIRRGTDSRWYPAHKVRGLFGMDFPRVATSTEALQNAAVPMTATPLEQNAEQTRTHSRAVLWSFGVACAMLFVLFVVWHAYSSRQLRITTANNRTSEAVRAANDWITENSPMSAETVEKQLVEALECSDATVRSNGEAALASVRKRRQQLRVKQAELEAAAQFDAAEKHFEVRDVSKALEVLRKYTNHPHATRKAYAQQLIVEADLATSDKLAMDALTGMSQHDFDQFMNTRATKDRRITHPIIRKIQSETYAANVPRAIARRRENELAAERRQDEARLAEEKRRDELARMEEQRRLAEAEAAETAKRRQEEHALEQKRLRDNPLTDVDLSVVAAFPERYYGKYITCPGVQIDHNRIKRQHDLRGGTFTLEVYDNKAKKSYSPVVYTDLFFSCSDRVAESLMTKLPEVSVPPYYSEITFQLMPHKTSLGRTVPEAAVHKIKYIRIVNLEAQPAVVFGD